MDFLLVQFHFTTSPLFISKLIINIKFIGIHIELNGKEKKHISHED